MILMFLNENTHSARKLFCKGRASILSFKKFCGLSLKCTIDVLLELCMSKMRSLIQFSAVNSHFHYKFADLTLAIFDSVMSVTVKILRLYFTYTEIKFIVKVSLTLKFIGNNSCALGCLKLDL